MHCWKKVWEWFCELCLRSRLLELALQLCCVSFWWKSYIKKQMDHRIYLLLCYRSCCLHLCFLKEYSDKIRYEMSSPVLNIYSHMRPESTYFQYHLKLMLKLFQPNFKLRWKICCVVRTCSNIVHVWHFDIYKVYLPVDKLPLLSDHVRRMTRLFRSIYVCEGFFSKLKLLYKSTRRWNVGEQPPSYTWHIRRNFENLVTNSCKLLTDVLPSLII
jgi:hypothetical protein